MSKKLDCCCSSPMEMQFVCWVWSDLKLIRRYFGVAGAFDASSGRDYLLKNYENIFVNDFITGSNINGFKCCDLLLKFKELIRAKCG